ncbi:MAG: FGGY-family carbohydrate kinase [Rhizobium sp.]|nr:FGGY-family carbohydrate kinase [Rhizobium sp.]
MGKYLVAVDVGTGSARAGVFDRLGRTLGRSSFPIAMKTGSNGFAEHDSEDIWRAVCRAVKGARDEAGIAPADVVAVGFDATCSLVVRDADGRPLSVTQAGEAGWDTIAWLDHRAVEEADALSGLGGETVRHSGGTISPEMQLPKLMWLKRNLPGTWSRAGMIFDLADFLTWRASGSLTRSTCTLTAKWSYLPHTPEGWRRDELAAAGLDDLGARAGISDLPAPVGSPLGPLTEAAAAELGLTTAAVVAPGMVDAYAGQLALVGGDPTASGHAGLIGGTSSCLMRFSDGPQYLRSFWGPYRDVVLPGRWVIEGGQSATGALLDHIVRTHGNGLEPTPGTHELILDRIVQLVAEQGEGFGARIRVLPDFHGNRAPLADARATGTIHGLTLDGTFDGMCAIYYRAMVSLALGIRQILDLMEFDGAIRTLHLGGGHARNGLLARLYADATRRQVAISAGEEAMLLGTAMAAATAAGLHPSLEGACKAMARPSTIIEPDEIRAERLDRDYRVFLRMQEQRRELDALA